MPATPDNIRRAAQALRQGRLVIIPTETVYGLAAVATDEAAVRRVFEAKRRPIDNPLIVHLANPDALPTVARDVPPEARVLAEHFWPGPLTLVLPKRAIVPDLVTAGLDTVAVRVPDSEAARALIEEVGAPLAAPSANTFMALSPTRAQDVEPDLLAMVELALDAGPCTIGVESTVVDCTGQIRVLRPGGVSRSAIEEALGRPIESGTQPRKAPGQYRRHYAPRTPLRLVRVVPPDAAGLVLHEARCDRQIAMPASPEAYAAQLYAALHRLDALGVPEILVEAPPEGPEWEAVWDRLRKASHP